jgi:hypothetical protein
MNLEFFKISAEVRVMNLEDFLWIFEGSLVEFLAAVCALFLSGNFDGRRLTTSYLTIPPLSNAHPSINSAHDNHALVPTFRFIVQVAEGGVLKRSKVRVPEAATALSTLQRCAQNVKFG